MIYFPLFTRYLVILSSFGLMCRLRDIFSFVKFSAKVCRITQNVLLYKEYLNIHMPSGKHGSASQKGVPAL